MSTLPSAFKPAEALDRIEAELRRRGIVVFARIDHAKGAEQAGLSLRPTQLLIFGNPEVGTRLMLAGQTIGIDLPLKVLAWLDAEGNSWVSYSQPEWLATRHELGEASRRTAHLMRETLTAVLEVVNAEADNHSSMIAG